MPIAGDKYQFTETTIDNSPNEAGVYALYDGNVIIYYGRATGGTVTIRSRLQDHLAGRDGYCTQQATAYKRQTTSRSVSREKELLEEYEEINQKLPRCNERIG